MNYVILLRGPCDVMSAQLTDIRLVRSADFSPQQLSGLKSALRTNRKGQLFLDRAIEDFPPSRVRVIVLFPEVTESAEIDPDDTPIAEVKASLRRALQEAKAGQTRPISEMWEGIDVE